MYKNIKQIISFSFVVFFIVSMTASCGIPSDSLLIKIRDGSKCKLNRYSFEMEEMTVSFTAVQVAVVQQERSELVVDIPIANQAPKTFKYKLKAEYENCSTIVSQDRQVERGYVIYESIYENRIDYDIRAK